MAIKQYSLAKDGAKQLSPAFKVREFRCRDGSDAIMIDQTIVVLLQAIREHFNKPITIMSVTPLRHSPFQPAFDSSAPLSDLLDLWNTPATIRPVT